MAMTPEEQKEFDTAKADSAALKAELEKLKTPPAKKEVIEEDGLREKAIKEKEAGDNKKLEEKRLESALRFTMGVAELVKANSDALPSGIANILATAEKEKYDSSVEKASAIKAAFIHEYFSVQANVDLLTASQKVALDDYLKLTKNGREQKSEVVYENLFEPALEMHKRLKKAEELSKARSGFASGNSVDDGYRDRLIKAARKTYLGEKE